MKVTVLLTTYNHEAYIGEALDSVLGQETNFPFEVVVLEDCSTDGTRAILQQYRDRNPGKVRLCLAAKNQCSNRAFVSAFRQATSPFIAMLDGDDYWTCPSKLQQQVDFMEAAPECALCFHNVLRVFEGQNQESCAYNPPEQKPHLTVDDLLEANFIAGCSPLVRRETLGSLPDWFESSVFGDWPLYVMAAERGTVSYLPEIMGVYRVHRRGLWSGSTRERQLQAVLAAYREFAQHLGAKYQPKISDRIFKISVQLEVEQSGVPLGVRLAVLSQGDGALVYLEGRNGQHFPQATDGTYAGAEVTNAGAIDHLLEVGARGAEYLLLPRNAVPWLTERAQFRAFVEETYERIWNGQWCQIFRLTPANLASA